MQHPEEPSNRPSPATDYGDTGSPGSSTGHSASIASTSTQATQADGAEEEAGLVEILQNLNLNVKHTYFVGRSSSVIFIRAAQALKEEYLASEFTGVVHGRAQIKDRQPEFLDATAVGIVTPSASYTTDHLLRLAFNTSQTTSPALSIPGTGSTVRARQPLLHSHEQHISAPS